MEYSNDITALFWVGFLFIATAGISALDLVILAALLKRSMLRSCLVLMSLSFIVAILYERGDAISRLLLMCLFLCSFFFLPIGAACFLHRAGRIHVKSESRSARIFEGAVIAVLIPCVLGLLVSMIACFGVFIVIETDPHGAASGNWAHM